MKYPSYSIQVIFLIFGASIAIFRPDFFAENKLLDDFVNHEFINLMAIVVTVSLVSVVHLHMEYTRIERKVQKRAFEGSRRSVNKNGVILIVLFALSFIISFIKGMPQIKCSLELKSIIHVIAMLSVFECVWIMYELIRTAYTIAKKEPL